MIIRRLAKGFQSQDWFTVVVEIMIVVVGIYIGLQVDDWQKKREEQQELNTYLQQVTADASNTVAMLGNHIRWKQRVVDGLDLVLESLDGKALTKEEQELAHFGLSRAGDLPPNPSRLETLFEMQNNGFLRYLPTEDLRQSVKAILGTFRQSTFYDARLLRMISAPPFPPTLVEYTVLVGDEDLTVKNYDVEKAKLDPNFKLRILQGQSVFKFSIRSNKLARQIILEILKMLKAEGFEPPENWVRENFDRISKEMETVN